MFNILPLKSTMSHVSPYWLPFRMPVLIASSSSGICEDHFFSMTFRSFFSSSTVRNRTRLLSSRRCVTERTGFELTFQFRGLRLPKNQEEAAAVGEVLRQTAGFVLDLRQAFDEQFESFEAGVTTMMRRHTEQRVRPKFVGFSDSFVASVPLRNDAGDLLPIVTGVSALSAAAVVMMMSLADWTGRDLWLGTRKRVSAGVAGGRISKDCYWRRTVALFQRRA